MAERLIDLRSDTVTVPSPGMRRAIAEAEVGDDVYGEDPTVRRLQEKTAELLGKEAALYVPSGTMSNEIAIRVHARPGDEVLCEQGSHIFCFEGGGPAALNGVMCRPLAGRRGILDVADFEGQRNPAANWFARTRLVALENTHNRGGGAIYPLDNIHRIAQWARANELALHLDGARLMNAVVATGVAARQWARPFDTVSICFSKGLGAPVGSCLAGPRELIAEARRYRQLFGGGMRQAGLLAAACIYALDHNVERLAEDHANAKRLASALAQIDGFQAPAEGVATNLVWFGVSPALGTAQEVAGRLREHGILVGALGAQLLRACTHLNVTSDDIDRAIDAARRIASERK